MSSLFTLPRVFVIDGAGDPRAGAKLFFYEAGTLTLQDTYSDNALTTPNTNPVVADAAGQFGPIYLAAKAYRVILKDSADVQLWDQDDYNAPLLGLFGSNVLTKSGNYTVSTDDKGNLIEFTATATASLPAVADAAQGFTLAIWNSGSGTVTIDPASTEQINGSSSLSLATNEWVIAVCDGSDWTAIKFHASASKVAIADAGSVITATNVETALQEIAKRNQVDVGGGAFFNQSTTLADVTGRLNLEANTNYAVKGTIYGSQNVGDIKWKLDISQTPSDTGYHWYEGRDETGTAPEDFTTNAQSQIAISSFTDGENFIIRFEATFTTHATLASTIALQAAQNASSANSTFIHAGTYLEVKKNT